MFMDKKTLVITPNPKTFQFPHNTIIRYIDNRSNVGIKLNIDGKQYELDAGLNKVEILVYYDTDIKYDENPTLSIDFEFIFFFDY